MTSTVGVAFTIEPEKYTEELEYKGRALAARSCLYKAGEDTKGVFTWAFALEDLPVYYLYYEYEVEHDSQP